MCSRTGGRLKFSDGTDKAIRLCNICSYFAFEENFVVKSEKGKYEEMLCCISCSKVISRALLQTHKKEK